MIGSGGIPGRGWILLSTILYLASPAVSGAESIIDLAGTWRFAVDQADAGVAERWFSTTLGGSIKLPGSMAENGLGDDPGVETKWTGGIVDKSWYKSPEYARYREPGNVKVPFWLNPVKVYLGPAWYQREVEIPSAWAGRRIFLELERCHWETRLWANGREIGMRNSLSTPHVYDLTDALPPGRHTLTIRVDNRIKDIDVGSNAHSVSDHTQTNWNGIVGRLRLRSTAPVYLEDVRVFPDVSRKAAKIRVVLRNATGRPLRGTLVLEVRSVGPADSRRLSAQVRTFETESPELAIEVDYPMGERAALWDEFSPALYELRARVEGQTEGVWDARSLRFGMREFKAAGTRFAVNGRPVFLRGTLECCIFPKTGYPAMTQSEWRRVFGVIKAHGLNHMRFHSWCPPEAAFDAADETGVYLYVECGAWTNVGDGKAIDRWLFEESERVVSAYGNHPSFCMMSYGNEPGGKNANAFLAKFVAHWKAKDGRRAYTTAAGWPLLPESDFHLSPEPRIQRWGEGLNSLINKQPPQTLFDFRDFVIRYDKPVVSHEIGQWCVYPNFREIAKYTGVLRTNNFEIFRDTLRAAGMEKLADDFLAASGKLQALCYKADVEAALRTPGFAGFELLDLHDFPGQGTALVGVLDAFWEEKGYVSPAEFRKFCDETVPLVRLPKMVFVSDERFTAAVEAAHFGPTPMGAVPQWRVTNKNGDVVTKGELPRLELPFGTAISLGAVDFPLDRFAAPAQYKLAVSLGEFENDWDFWVYPPPLPVVQPSSPEVRAVRSLDAETADFLQNGGRVILTAERGAVRLEKGGSVAVGFSSIFWNTAWTSKQPPHTLGILCLPAHPALADFPTEFHANWQWRDAMSHAQAVVLSDFGPALRPIVRIIDDWFTNRPLGLIFEVKVGRGGLIVTGIDLLSDQEKRPEARQLLASLARYAASDEFRPSVEASVEIIRGLFKK
ncbi:MAG: beta-galactosidase [Candidatus Aminicenantes bacterium]|nr:beta-galactosidase [Candidatus Aminicenantes bacterium]